MSKPLILVILCNFMLAAATTAAPTTKAAVPADWGYSADGAHVLNLSARVVWARCVEGMRWNGQHCVGEPLRLNHADALAWAKKRAQAEGLAWRMPHLKELQHLLSVDKSMHRAGTAALLPEPPEGWCWTATVSVDTATPNAYRYDNVMRGVTAQNSTQLKFLHGWAVNLATQEARGDALRRSELLVRLAAPLD